MASMWSLLKVRSVYVKVKSLSVRDQRVSASHASPKVKCQSRLRHLEMELGMSDLTAPFTVDQGRQGPLKQHKWGPSVPVPIHAQYLGTEGTKVQGHLPPRHPWRCPSFRGRARLGGWPRNWLLWPAHGLDTDRITVLAVRARGPAQARLDFFETHRQNRRRE